MQGLRKRTSWWPVATLLAIALVAFAPTAQAQVSVDGDVSGNAVPGGTVMVSAVVDGATPQTYSWRQVGGVDAVLTGANTATVTVNLGSRNAYKMMLFHVLAEPPIGPEQLPPNVPLPEGEFPGGLQDRFQVVGLNPFTLEETGLVVLELEVTTPLGTFTGEVEIHTTLPWKVTTGLRTVPVGIPVLLHGKEQVGYDWTLTTPGGSGATLVGAGAQNPEFIPDVPGMYEVMVTDESNEEAKNAVLMDIYADRWDGFIDGQDTNGRPLVDQGCMVCHNDVIAPDYFTPWAQTGHAEIFTNNLNTSTHYSESCFSCHTVGFDPDVDNGGIDEAPDYQAFLGAGLLNNPGDNWTTVLMQFPETAKRANIQCENCHGPQEEFQAHGGRRTEPRVSLSADVCASCHGEPLRHARFQQWQLSGHANYELAIDEGESGNCSRCHTGNGFLTWLPILLDDDPATDPTADIEVTWTADEVHPQTCQTCHDPHNIGTTSGDDSNATVRISGNTPPLLAGFGAADVGRGAICMTCHNSRNGLRNDANFDAVFGTSEAARAPHGSSQTDILMGQNAYLVQVGVRGNHSLTANVPEVCVTCHMEDTPPPAVLSYNQGGSNHTFFADENVCAECHPGITAPAVQNTVEANLLDLKEQIEEAFFDLIDRQTDAGNAVDFGGGNVVTSSSQVLGVEFGETRGRQAIGVALSGGTVVGLTRLPDIDVVRPGGTRVELQNVAPRNLLKGGWNWLLVNNDGSLGVHNPTYVTRILAATRTALQTGGGGCMPDEVTLCFFDGRFSVNVEVTRPGSPPAMAEVGFREAQWGTFFFFEGSNIPNAMVTMGPRPSGTIAVQIPPLQAAQLRVMVMDHITGDMQVYVKPQGDLRAIIDPDAFPQ